VVVGKEQLNAKPATSADDAAELARQYLLRWPMECRVSITGTYKTDGPHVVERDGPTTRLYDRRFQNPFIHKL
jgi:nicotinamide mononucleotide (NMN) deamidase PncC